MCLGISLRVGGVEGRSRWWERWCFGAWRCDFVVLVVVAMWFVVVVVVEVIGCGGCGGGDYL